MWDSATQNRPDRTGMEDQCPNPAHLNWDHQDSVFANTFQAKSNFIVHPEWLSEAVDQQPSVPLSRAPWPWEQPRYRVNLQKPLTYQSPAECQPPPNQPRPEENPQCGGDVGGVGEHPIGTSSEDVCPVTQAMFRNYLFTHPAPLVGELLYRAQDIVAPVTRTSPMD